MQQGWTVFTCKKQMNEIVIVSITHDSTEKKQRYRFMKIRVAGLSERMVQSCEDVMRIVVD